MNNTLSEALLLATSIFMFILAVSVSLVFYSKEEKVLNNLFDIIDNMDNTTDVSKYQDEDQYLDTDGESIFRPTQVPIAMYLISKETTVIVEKDHIENDGSVRLGQPHEFVNWNPIPNINPSNGKIEEEGGSQQVLPTKRSKISKSKGAGGTFRFFTVVEGKIIETESNMILPYKDSAGTSKTPFLRRIGGSNNDFFKANDRYYIKYDILDETIFTKLVFNFNNVYKNAQ